jgi:hypothetical protein
MVLRHQKQFEKDYGTNGHDDQKPQDTTNPLNQHFACDANHGRPAKEKKNSNKWFHYTGLLKTKIKLSGV